MNMFSFQGPQHAPRIVETIHDSLKDSFFLLMGNGVCVVVHGGRSESYFGKYRANISPQQGRI
jgi:hypothetical protein